MALNKLTTHRGEALAGIPWNVYPRPQLRRESFLNLNGTWEVKIASPDASPNRVILTDYDHHITVPFCPECDLSGIGIHHPEGSLLCYRRTFQLPEDFRKDRVLLHIGAADQICDVYVNSRHVAHHEGGYTSFSADITDAVIAMGQIQNVEFIFIAV